MNKLFKLAAAVGLAAAFGAGAAHAAEALPKTHLRIVGSLSNLGPYKDFEQPFWSKHIPDKSAGAVTAEIRGFDQMGMKGPEVLRLLGQGVMEFAGVPMYYLAADDAAIEMIDVAGLLPDAETARKVTEATRPFYEKLLREKFKVELIGIGSFPAQVLYCNGEIKSLADVKGKKVRVGGRSQSELVAALGGTPVTMAFGEVVPALQTKTVDCGITGSMSGNLAKWHEVTTHLLALPLGWAQIAYAVNNKTWNGLDPKVRGFIDKEMKTLEHGLWSAAASVTEMGYTCNAGKPGCQGGLPGKLVIVQASKADHELLRRIESEVMLPKWSERCDANCVAEFNATAGKIVGLTAKKK
ncbi:MAG: TRAP transporter substrate-binding protein [Rhodocyclales bacterium]|nr:TRAP transporter substrate-binding protein [Rhodocyclales bacterium]